MLRSREVSLKPAFPNHLMTSKLRQDQPPSSTAATRIRSGKKGDGFGRTGNIDSFGRPSSGDQSGRKMRLLPVQAPTSALPFQVYAMLIVLMPAATRSNLWRIQARAQKSSSALPPRLQNLFQKPKDRGMSRAEAEFLTLKAYAPDWRPSNQKVRCHPGVLRL